MEEIFEKKLIQAAQAVEQQVIVAVSSLFFFSIQKNLVFCQVDAELNRLEQLTENDIEKMRNQRLEAMKQEHKKRQDWMANGRIYTTNIEFQILSSFLLRRPW